MLEKESLFEMLLDEINEQLANQGLLIRTGEVNIIDASVIEAHKSRPKKARVLKIHKIQKEPIM